MALALHFDPYAGISAAAALGALLDVGLDADALRAGLAPLALPPWTLTTERATAGVTGTRATIAVTGDDTPLSLGAVRALLAASGLASATRERGLRVLTLVAAGEWGTARDDDPAGTPETILAILGTLVGLDLLGIAEITTVAPPQGRAGSPVTPAAAALLATVATERPPTLRLRRVGYGLGPHDLGAPHPTAVRVWLGEAEGRDGIDWQSLLAPATPDATPAAILLVLDHADEARGTGEHATEAGAEYDRLTALVAAWAGAPARLCALSGARDGTGPTRVDDAIAGYAAAGARRIVIQRLGLVPDPAIEEALAGSTRRARGRWPGLAIIPAPPLLTARQLAYRLAGRATAAWETLSGPDQTPAADTAILLVAPGSAEAEANAEAYRLARLLWEGRDWLTVEVAFLGETTPDLGAAVSRCARLGARAVVALPLLPLAGGGAAALTAQVAALRAAGAALPIVGGRAPGTPEGFAAIAWEGFRAASGLPVGDAGHGHGHGADGGHGDPAALRSILPPRYQGGASVNSAPMGAADLVYDEDGQVAWGAIWEGFCDLAIAGGPPHRGDLLEPATRDVVEAAPGAYTRALDELARGLRLITGWAIVRDAAPGWIGLVCPDEEAAIWLLRAILSENIAARREGATLFLPAGPHFAIEKEIKNVVTVTAKTHHYWTEHIAALAGPGGAAWPAPVEGRPDAAPPEAPVPAEPPIVGTDRTLVAPGRRWYAYACGACGERFDRESPVATAGEPAPCPFCGAQARRLFTAPRLLFKADPRDTQPVWHNHGGYGHSHAPGKGVHGAVKGQEQTGKP
jgi:sirohydrochlorin cobaltochelatase